MSVGRVCRVGRVCVPCVPKTSVRVFVSVCECAKGVLSVDAGGWGGGWRGRRVGGGQVNGATWSHGRCAGRPYAISLLRHLSVQAPTSIAFTV